MTRPAVGVVASLVALTLIGFFEFPGHTWLQQDTQIYIPIFERIWDPTALVNDLVATKPHVSFTIYDETAMALRWISRTSFHVVLSTEQFVFRLLQLAGVYLLARTFALSRHMAVVVAGCFGLGATIVGPAVLTFEYEPTPRAFALGFLFLAIGLAARGHAMPAAWAAAIGFLYHPPTSVPVWIVFILIAIRRRDYRPLAPLACACVLLAVAARFQTGATEPQPFFSRIDPGWEKLERMRASYNWVSMWANALFWQYLFFWAVTVVALWRMQWTAASKDGRWFTLGLPLIGILSVPVSYLLTERVKWAIMPQVQPARAVLWTTAFAAILGAAAGIRAAERRRWWEAVLWFTIVFAIPLQARIFEITVPHLALAVVLGGLLCAAVIVAQSSARYGLAALAVAIVVPYFAIPGIGGVVNYPWLHTPQLDQLASYARTSTPKDAMFLFPDAGQGLYPGLFRCEAIRPVYVDWKAGGQVNYFRSLAEDWWARWQATMSGQNIAGNLTRFRELGIDYVVLKRADAIATLTPVYTNDAYVVYRLTP